MNRVTEAFIERRPVDEELVSEQKQSVGQLREKRNIVRLNRNYKVIF